MINITKDFHVIAWKDASRTPTQDTSLIKFERVINGKN